MNTLIEIATYRVEILPGSTRWLRADFEARPCCFEPDFPTYQLPDFGKLTEMPHASVFMSVKGEQ